mmetsp:Transcript_27169/g.60126  ORF Transcript_27169/g.60126 Transcript_27169/m.60126 type:complete len:258 (-) Transcript_27169:582-1355(-)
MTFSPTRSRPSMNIICAAVEAARRRAEKEVYVQARMISIAPRAVFQPTVSPSTVAANAVLQRGSVEKSTVDSSASSFCIATFSAQQQQAVVTTPVQSSAAGTLQSETMALYWPFSASASAPCPASYRGSAKSCAPQTILTTATIANEAAVKPAASPGASHFSMCFSTRKKAKPKRSGWSRAHRSPVPGRRDPPSSRHPTPAAASRAGKNESAKLRTFESPFRPRASVLRKGTTTTCRLQMKPTTEAGDELRAFACAQ